MISKIDETFLVKLSTGLAYLVGNPNFDSMTAKYYARFYVKHQDSSDSYLRKAYTNLDLHTDGTYVNEVTDWLLMSKIDEQNVQGGETAMLHLDDWEHCEDMLMTQLENKILYGDHQKVKMLTIKLNTLEFQKIKMANLQFLILTNFQSQKIWSKVYSFKDYLMLWKKVKIK